MRFRNLTRHLGIGANSYLLETSGSRIILDSGMHPKFEAQEALPDLENLEENSADAIVVTHAHLDHVGSLPLAHRRHPNAKVFVTPATSDLAEAMLHNSVNVMQSKRLELGITEYPLFTHQEIEDMLPRFEHRATDRPFDLDHDGKVRATFHDAGHILGSVGVKIVADGKTLFYTGDVNFEHSTLIKGAIFPTEPVDALIIETTRGAVQRPADYTRASEERRLASAINDVISRGGSVLIPVFAIGKTQELLTMIHQFKKRGQLPKKTPVYIGGLSTKMTVIYDRHAETTRRRVEGFEVLKEMDLEAGSRKRPGPIPLYPGCIYALSSGMMTEKTVSNAFAQQGFIDNPKNGLFFVGYADPESPAGKIIAAGKGEIVQLDPSLPGMRLNCATDTFDFSGHAIREDLVRYIKTVKPKKTFLVHGDEAARQWFVETLRREMPEMETIVPEPGTDYEI